MQILVAEDDPISQRLITTILEAEGHDLLVASDGEEAWRQYETAPVRLVVSDWLMPNADGLELCERIRRHPHADYTYFILVTANNAERKNYLQAMDVGVDDFLTKPLDRTELILRLRVAQRILHATSRIRSLENVLTICAYTKKIRMPLEGWETIEEFLKKQCGITLSHGVDPDHYENVIKPQLEALKRSSNEKPALGEIRDRRPRAL